MRKLTFVLAFFASCFFANAQETSFKPFKVDLAFGYAIPSGSGSKGGVLFAVEPKYALNDNITLGLRMEAAVTARAAVTEDGEIGRASCRERVEMWVGVVSVKKKKEEEL